MSIQPDKRLRLKIGDMDMRGLAEAADRLAQTFRSFNNATQSFQLAPTYRPLFDRHTATETGRVFKLVEQIALPHVVAYSDRYCEVYGVRVMSVNISDVQHAVAMRPSVGLPRTDLLLHHPIIRNANVALGYYDLSSSCLFSFSLPIWRIVSGAALAELAYAECL